MIVYYINKSDANYAFVSLKFVHVLVLVSVTNFESVAAPVLFIVRRIKRAVVSFSREALSDL